MSRACFVWDADLYTQLLLLGFVSLNFRPIPWLRRSCRKKLGDSEQPQGRRQKLSEQVERGKRSPGVGAQEPGRGLGGGTKF